MFLTRQGSVAEQTPICNFGWKAQSFSLPGVDGKTYSLADIRGKNGTLVIFICNHCPYVKAVIDRIVRDADELKSYGINTVAISSNDAVHYPEDSFDNMKRFAKAHGFTFPYLYDESQDVARAWGAERTPHVFVLDADLELRYEGAPDGDYDDESRDAEWLRGALDAVLAGERPPQAKTDPVGCTIKWR
jgi:peroxiredoxin